jgi:exodeoxyribonuclease III
VALVMGARLALAFNMRLITWNVNGRVTKLNAQAQRVSELEADVVCLQEVTRTTVSGWTKWFEEWGFHSRHSLSKLPEDTTQGRRRYGVLIASRWRIGEECAVDLVLPWAERSCSAHIETSLGGIELHTTHLPAGSADRNDGTHSKSETFESIAAQLSTVATRHRILCGDFNSPEREWLDGRIMCFGGRVAKDGTIVPGKTERSRRQLAAEESVMIGLRQHGWRDMYRALHPASDELIDDHSFQNRNRGNIFRKRFDHVFASGPIEAVSAQYDLESLENGLSDHAGLVVDLA